MIVVWVVPRVLVSPEDWERSVGNFCPRPSTDCVDPTLVSDTESVETTGKTVTSSVFPEIGIGVEEQRVSSRISYERDRY